ncbi:MAG: tetratricopeptide repeat protein [Pseudomonadota bacterium]
MRRNTVKTKAIMTLSNRSLPKPETWQEFEHHAWLLFRSELNDPATEKNGRQGQAQHGVDVYGRRDCKHWVGVQCKQKMDEAVSESELREEVEKAKSFSPKIKEYLLVTTARRDAGIQKAAREITDELKGTEHEFSVSVWGWDQFQEHASMHSDVWEKIDPTWDPYTKRGLDQLNVSIGELKDTVSAALPDARNDLRTAGFDAQSEKESSARHTKISVFVEMIESGNVETGHQHLRDLKESDWDSASPSEKYRILIGLASSALKLGNDGEAYSLIERACDVCPDHKSAKRNLATSKLLQGEYEQARELAGEAVQARPDDEIAAGVLVQARSFLPADDLLDGLSESVLDKSAVKAALCQAARNRDDPAWLSMAVEAYQSDQSDDQIRLNWAEAVLELELQTNARSAQGGSSEFPRFEDLQSAADELYQACVSRRSRFSLATIHNAGLALRLVGRNDDAKQVLEMGFAIQPREPSISLQLAIIAHEVRDFAQILELLDEDSDHPENISLRAEAIAHVNSPSEALDLLEGIDSSNWSHEHRLMLLSSELTSLSKQGDWATAIAKCRRAVEGNPGSVRFKILLARVLRISGDTDAAASQLDQISEDFPSDSTMAERVEIATEYRQLGVYDPIVTLLEDQVSTQHDSEALRLLFSALVSGRKHRAAITLFAKLTPELNSHHWYLRARSILAINSGAADMENHLNAYLRVEPDDLEMQISRLGLWQLQGRENEIRLKLRNFESNIPDGSPIERMRLCHLAVQYGNKKWGVDAAYQELIANWDDAAIHLAYQGLILMYDDLESAIPKSMNIQENCVFETRSRDGVRRARIEATAAHNFEAERHSPSGEFAKVCLGKSVGEKFTITTQFQSMEFEILWIKPRALDLLHKSMEEFNKRFPMNSGMQRVTFDFEAENPLEDMERVTKAAHERDQSVLDKYAANALPFCFVANALGKDVIDGWAGLPGVGIQPRVCIGSRDERDNAIRYVQARSTNGCVLDPITAALISDFHLWGTISKVCGHVHVTHSTLEIFAKREIEAKNSIDRRTGMTSWQDGRLILIEISPEQNKAAYDEKKRQREDVLAHCKIATALPQTDLSGQNLSIAEMLGEAARDSVLAADGNELLLLSEDQGLRQWAVGALEIGASWLQPVLLLAKDRGLISTEDYTKFIVDCLKRNFTYVSMDSQTLLAQAKVEGFNARGTVKRMLEVLGGKNADLDTNLGVAAMFLDLVFYETKQRILRDRYASLVLKAFCGPRRNHTLEVIKALTARVSFNVDDLINHAVWWFTGQLVGTPQFSQQFEELKNSRASRRLMLEPAIVFPATERNRLMGSCFPN